MNISRLFNIILTCFNCILGYLRLYFTSGKGVKSIDKFAYIIAAGISSTGTRDTYIDSTYNASAWIRFASIRNICVCIRNTYVRRVKPYALARLKIILISLKINYCCLQLSIKLIFALTKKLSC